MHLSFHVSIARAVHFCPLCIPSGQEATIRRSKALPAWLPPPACWLRLSPRHPPCCCHPRAARRSRRPGGHWPPVHRQPRPAPEVLPGRAAQPIPPRHLLHPGGRGVRWGRAWRRSWGAAVQVQQCGSRITLCPCLCCLFGNATSKALSLHPIQRSDVTPLSPRSGFCQQEASEGRLWATHTTTSSLGPIPSPLCSYIDYPFLQDTEYAEEYLGARPCALNEP